jgi:hypothetical protein
MIRTLLFSILLIIFTPSKGIPAPIPFADVGPVIAIDGAEHRIGGLDRMFLIEDQWEFDRCKLLLPTLPAIDLTSNSYLVLMSWGRAPRSLKSAESDGDTLVLNVEQAKPPQYESGAYHPPKFLIYKLPRWKGPVRFDVNGETRVTVLRGDALAVKASQIWHEILRIHSGGGASPEQKIKYFKRMWPDTSEKEIRGILLRNKDKYRTIEVGSIYRSLFQDLVDIRANPVIPRVYTLIESMGKHDKALGPACTAIVGIGGNEAVELAKSNLDSWNPECRSAAMGILGTLGLPDTRSIAYDRLVSGDGRMTFGALRLLQQLGITPADIPAMDKGLQYCQDYYHGKVKIAFATRTEEMSNSLQVIETFKGIMYAFGEMGTEGKDALPALERVVGDTQLPGAFRGEAKDAIKKIRPQPDHSDD